MTVDYLCEVLLGGLELLILLGQPPLDLLPHLDIEKNNLNLILMI